MPGGCIRIRSTSARVSTTGRRLILRRRRDTLAHRQIREELLHVRDAQGARVLKAMKADELPHPVPVGLFGAQAEMPYTHLLPHDVEQEWWVAHGRLQPELFLAKVASAGKK